jgi:homocitrate synthase
MSTLNRFHLVDTTLREGEQFASAHFTSAQRIALAHILDSFGAEFIEMTSPAASPQSAQDLQSIANLGLRATILTHVRCHRGDVEAAIRYGAQGVNMLFATSEPLRSASHGRSISQILIQATDVVNYALDQGVQVRFSCEDAFRTDPNILVDLYGAMDLLGVHRVGIADTVGIATPNQVHQVVSRVRQSVGCGIEFHGHNDTGCATANALSAIEAGATHIDVTVLGIGERNGITPLSGLIARIATLDWEQVRRYRLELLPTIDQMTAEFLDMEIPFTSPITSPTAFTHKAGMHTKAVLNSPQSYEVLDPAWFGLSRTIHVGSRLTGRHALAARAKVIGLQLSDCAIRSASLRLKALADSGSLGMEQVDTLLREAAICA